LAALAPRHQRLSYEVVYQELRRAILDGTVPSGTRLVELELAEQLQVSRTPVREALRRLESDGFAQRVGGASGLVVTPSGPDDLGDIGLLRIEVDGLAARLAAARGSRRDWDELSRRIETLRVARDSNELSESHLGIHRAIYAIAFSPRMSGFVENQLLAYIEVSVSVGPGYEEDPEGSYRQHLQLFRALSSGSVERAVAAARDHAAGGVKFARRRPSALGSDIGEPDIGEPDIGEPHSD
jgi:DNA-binding GntR family transcriptional regulator